MLFYPPLSQLSILFFASAVLLLTIAGLVWRRTATTRVTDWFLVVLVSDAAWALTSIIPLEAGVASVAFAGQASAVAASNVAAVSWVMFSLVYTGRGDVLTRRRLIVLTLPLLLGVGAFATAPFHPLAISDLAVTVRPTATLLTYQLGPLSILPTVYTLSLVSLGTGLVAWTALTDPELYADQTIGLLVGALMPIAGAALTLSGVYDVGNTNITPATLGITAIGYGYALFRTDLLQTGPGVAVQGEDIAIERLSEGFLVVDGRGIVVEANTAAHELINHAPLTNESLTDLLAIASPPTSGQHRFRLDDGTVLEAQVTSIGPDDHDEAGQVITLRDVTARERRQERLQVLNRVLRHNVRNELDVVRAYAQQLATADSEQIDTPDAANQIVDTVDTLLSTAEKARTVEQLLAADGDPRQEPVALSGLLSDCVAGKRSETAESTDITTSLPTECEIRSDGDVLRLVIDELLDNALQHTDDVASVWVRLSCDDAIHIEIADDGPGIPTQERQAVLDGTERALTHASQFGLWMVRWGVLYLGGDLSISDREPTGTVVTIRLPQNSAEQV